MSRVLLQGISGIVFLLLMLVGCNTSSDELSKDKAVEIALDDIYNLKPTHTEFSIYEVERKNMNYRNTDNVYDSWVIIIRSLSQSGEELTLYQINALNGRIIDTTNYAEEFETT